MAVIVEGGFAFLVDAASQPKGGGLAGGNAGCGSRLLPGEAIVHAGDQLSFGRASLLPLQLS